MNLLREQEVTPYKVNQVWETFRWLSRIFGLLDVNEFHRLKTKKKAMEEELADTTIKPQRKATVPSKEVIWALEEGAASLDIPDLEATGAPSPEASLTGHTAIQKMMDAFILGIARFQVGCSARFNDLQHVHPKNPTQTSTTVELQAWQTKTVSTSKIRKQLVPLICPKYSFTGKPWWLPFLALVTKMVSLKQFENMDYLIPTINKEFRGIIARPSTPNRALSWLKEALHRQGVAKSAIDPLTWHSFRVFIPDCAFQLHIPRDQRQYLGNWLTESTADVYTREKRNVVVDIWSKVAGQVGRLNLGAGRERREDLEHPDWQDPVAVDLEAPEPTRRTSAAASPHQRDGQDSSAGRSSLDSWKLVDEQEEGPEPKELFPAAASDLRVVSSQKGSGPHKKLRIHLLNSEGVAVGCGWRPKSGAIQDLNPDDFASDPDGFGKCERCFKADEQEIQTVPQDTDSSLDSGSETDDSVDTESDQEGVDIPELLRVIPAE